MSPHGCTDNPDIMFIGGYPSTDECRRDQAFGGNAGRLLRELITALELDPDSIYYTHAVKCRRPGGAKPTARIIKACNPNLLDEIERVNPRILVPMGNEAISSILGGGRGVTRRRGIYSEVNGRMVVPTLEPSRMSPELFPDLVTDLRHIKHILNGGDPVVYPPYDNYVLIDNQEGFDSLMNRLTEVGRAAIDIETDGLDFLEGHILCMGFSWARGTACVMDWHGLVHNNLDNFSRVKRVLENIDCYFHNAQFDVLWMRARGINPNLVGDTMLMHYCLDERPGSHGLNRLAIDRYRAPEYDEELKAMLRARRKARKDKTPVRSVEVSEEDRKSPLLISLDDWSDDDVKQAVMLYNGADADFTWRLVEDLSSEMETEGVTRVHDEILIPAANHFIELEMSGLLVDTEYHESLGRDWRDKMEKVESELRSYKGAEDINLNSPKQVSEFMFDVLGLTPMPSGRNGEVSSSTILKEIQKVDDPEAQNYWRTAASTAYTGIKATSTNTYMLYWLAQQHPWPRLLIEYRDYAKMLGTYYQGYKDITYKDGRIRPRYRIHGTRTGRLSSTDPNIHGMPRQDIIKNIFIADPGFTLIHADYSQAEIRMMAHFAKDERLIEVMGETDIHRAISRQIFRLTEEELSQLPDEDVSFKRRAAKTIAFGLIYGRSPESIAPQLGISVDEAEKYIEDFFLMMPDVRSFIARQKRNVIRDQEVESLYGRKRRFPFIANKYHAAEVQRQAVNMPIQSSVSDMTLLANIRIINTLRSQGVEVRPWPHIHDGFLIQVPDHLVEPSVKVVIDTMHDVGFDTEVNFAMEVEVGKRWGEMKTVYNG